VSYKPAFVIRNTVHNLEIMPWIMRKMEYHSIIIVTQIIAAFKKHFVTLYQSLAHAIKNCTIAKKKMKEAQCYTRD